MRIITSTVVVFVLAGCGKPTPSLEVTAIEPCGGGSVTFNSAAPTEIMIGVTLKNTSAPQETSPGNANGNPDILRVDASFLQVNSVNVTYQFVSTNAAHTEIPTRTFPVAISVAPGESAASCVPLLEASDAATLSGRSGTLLMTATFNAQFLDGSEGESMPATFSLQI